MAMRLGKWQALVVSSLFMAIVVPLALARILETVTPNWRWEHHLIHTYVEGAGSLIALLIAAVILILQSYHRLNRKYLWVALAMISMGVLDGFHASLHAGQLFVWLHSLATLAGGLLIMMVWLPKGYCTPTSCKVISSIVLVVSVGVGLASIIYEEALPAMVIGEQFTYAAKAINFLGGAGFIAAWGYFVFCYRQDADIGYALLAHHCLLFGAASLLFEFSALWDATWWIWHGLRLVAYAVLMFYFFDREDLNFRFLVQNFVSKYKPRGFNTEKYHKSI